MTFKLFLLLSFLISGENEPLIRIDAEISPSQDWGDGLVGQIVGLK